MIDELLKKAYFTHLLTRFADSLIAAAGILFCCFMVYWLIRNKSDTKKQKTKLNLRLIYVGVFVYIFLLAKIWVPGFTHIFTMLSIVAAGLVVTNKETIMNFVGFFIIHWRSLFVKGDFIMVQNYAGYVDHVGFLYFKLFETNMNDIDSATGRTIRIPNGLLINNPVYSLSSSENICRFSVPYTLSTDSDLSRIVEQLEKLLNNTLKDYYHNDEQYILDNIKHRNKLLRTLIDLTPKLTIEPLADKPDEVKLTLQFYCYPKDFANIKQTLWKGFFLDKSQ